MSKQPGDQMYRELSQKGMLVNYSSNPRLFEQNRDALDTGLNNYGPLHECI